MSKEIEDKYCWKAFKQWCEGNGVDLEYKEDWTTWWHCWCAGIDALREVGK